MAWIEAKSGVKFLCWGKLKDNLDKDDAVVVKENEHIEGLVERLDHLENDQGNMNYKIRLKTKDIDESVVIWGNAALNRQIEQLEVKEGDKVRLTFEGMYTTNFGGKGYNIRLAVDR